MASPFFHPVEMYKRDLNVAKNAMLQVAKYLSLNLDISFEEAENYVKSNMAKQVNDPKMMSVVQKRPGERVPEEVTFLSYIKEASVNNRVLSASMVQYEDPTKRKATTSIWIEKNIKLRKVAKNRMFTLGQKGDVVGSELADYEQNARKIRINSVSGMRGSKCNPLYMLTGHSSLTSFCRSAAGYGNGTVERVLGGGRQYYTYEIAKADMMAILMTYRDPNLEEIVTRFGIRYPTVDETFDVIYRSTSLYCWDNTHELEMIRTTISKMTDIERAMICYSGDLYHFSKYNPELVKEMFSALISTDLDTVDISTVEEVDTLWKSLSSNDKAYVVSICGGFLKGKVLDDVRLEDPATYITVGKCARSLHIGLEKYHDIINTFLAPLHLPPVVASAKSIMRRAGLSGDTDASVFATDWWVEWYTGELKRGDVQDRIWYLMTYILGESVVNSLAMLSTNIGVEKKRTFELSMKNEYGFPVFGNTNLAKHYYATMSIREGNILRKIKLEIKGVNLRGSTIPKHVLQAQEELIDEICDKIDRDIPLYGKDILDRIANQELDTIRSICNGEYTYLKSDSVKPNTKKMFYNELWDEVFAPKYGKGLPPPYPCVKVSLALSNKTEIKEWLESIGDKEFAARMGGWLLKRNRTDFKSILLPTTVIAKTGLPVEIQQAANVKKLAFEINTGFYRILESLGLFVVDREYRRLVYELLDLVV